MKFVTTYQMSAINSCWGKCDKKWAYTKCMFKAPHEVQANPRSSDGGEEDRKSEKSERSEHSEPQQPEPEVEAVVAAVNEVTFSIQDQ
jgi:hypothetical protein